MQTECTSKSSEFQALGKRQVSGAFNGGAITSDGGGLLLREMSLGKGIISRFSSCFVDYRNPNLIDHTVEELVGQRVFGLCLGYEDLNDHDDLRSDPLFAALVGKLDPAGMSRRRESDKGKALAGKATLNRFELTPLDADESNRYKKIVYNSDQIDRFFVEMFLDSYERVPDWIVLDADATDDPTYGDQEGRFFHGYYNHYCYLPLYIFCDGHILCSRLRRSNIDASAGTVKELGRIMGQIRERWPEVKIIVRGDSGFCREEIMSWCEGQREVYYLLGIAKNNRLVRRIGKALMKARKKYLQRKESARLYRVFKYRTLESWSRKRTVVGKAEHLAKGPNPRFIVTNLPQDFAYGKELYEKYYCARGDMENRIKEQQLWLFAGRTSTELMRSNQLRLYFSSVAYVLMSELRRVGLKGTQMEKAQVETIRNKLFKIGALVKISVRRVYIMLSSSYPHSGLFKTVLSNIKRGYPLLA